MKADKYYLGVSEIRNIIKKYNALLCPNEQLTFLKKVDNSLYTPRVKECHNVIIGNGIKIVSYVSNRHSWILELDGQTIFDGLLIECIEKYIAVKNEVKL